MIRILKQRRSIRKYKDESVNPQEIKDLLRAALLSPASKGISSNSFLVVDDREALKKLALCKVHGAGFLAQAPLAVVVLSDPQISDVWIENSSIAAIIVHLTAASMNIGSCWIQIRNRFNRDDVSSEKYVREVLNIPDRYRVGVIIAAGYADEQKAAHVEDPFPNDKVFLNIYGNKLL
ncbi:MAG: nitroreductase family protein [Syntrophomonadaceae bacterium]|nr:nitroreductase family protein [Syntrophomonadaceae bacterium]